jgi:hypothetical protein
MRFRLLTCSNCTFRHGHHGKGGIELLNSSGLHLTKGETPS